MTAGETLRAAAESLRAENTPRSDAVADWLDDSAQNVDDDIVIYRRHELDPVELINKRYHHPLNVARIVLEETT